MDESHGSSDTSDAPHTSWFDTLSDVDLLFVKALHQLRCERTRERYGLALLKNMGPVVVMTNQRLRGSPTGLALTSFAALRVYIAR